MVFSSCGNVFITLTDAFALAVYGGGLFAAGLLEFVETREKRDRRDE